MLYNIFKIAIVLIIFYTIYDIFISDNLNKRIEKFRERKIASQEKTIKINSFEKIAKVKLVSDDIKDIEKFIINNAQDLSETTVNKLVEHIESIKNDNIIYEDLIKTRIENILPQKEAVESAKTISMANKKGKI